MPDALSIHCTHISERVQSIYACKSARVMPEVADKRGQTDGRFMLVIVDAICSRYGEWHVHALHTCERSKSIWRAKPTYPRCGTRYMVAQMHVYAMTGWAWQSWCGVGCAIGAMVSFLSTPCHFLSHSLPSHLLTSYQVRECASW